MGFFSLIKKDDSGSKNGDMLPAVNVDSVKLTNENWADVLPQVLATNDMAKFESICLLSKKIHNEYGDYSGALINNRKHIVRSAATAGSVDALRVIYGCWGNSFIPIGNEKFVLEVLRGACKSEHLDFWNTLVNLRRDGWDDMPEMENIVVVAVEEKKPAFIDAVLGKAEKKDKDIFNAAVCSALQETDEIMKHVLSYVEKFKEAHEVLDDALCRAIKVESVEKTRMLLENGADSNHNDGAPMCLAGLRDNPAIFDLLLAHGGDLEKHGVNVLAYIGSVDRFAPLIPYVEEKNREAVKRARIFRMNERYSLTDPDTVTEVQEISADLTLSTAFNFRSRQQVFVVEKKSTGQLTMCVQSFDDIGDVRAIELARQKLQDLDGNVYPESVVGRKTVDKTRSLSGP
jgi:hypothetical protein